MGTSLPFVANANKKETWDWIYRRKPALFTTSVLTVWNFQHNWTTKQSNRLAFSRWRKVNKRTVYIQSLVVSSPISGVNSSHTAFLMAQWCSVWASLLPRYQLLLFGLMASFSVFDEQVRLPPYQCDAGWGQFGQCHHLQLRTRHWIFSAGLPVYPAQCLTSPLEQGC